MPAARLVGPHGRVDAVDLAGALPAQGRAAATGLPQRRFVQADVLAWEPPDGAYDRAQCGYGVFFLPDMNAGGRHLVGVLARTVVASP